jgi:aryl-alcohol dehydrogenase-like predicted oxidoreductase
LATAHAATPSAVALAWTLETVPMAHPVIGPTGMAELEDALVATRLALSPDDLAWLTSVS